RGSRCVARADASAGRRVARAPGLRARLPPVSVFIRDGTPMRVATAPGARRWHLVEECGREHGGRAGDRVQLPDLPLGYHRLRVGWDDAQAESSIIVTPRPAFLPDCL